MPITKNNTSRAQPMAWSAPLMFWITVQTVPPLKFSGVVETNVQISASFPFHVPRAELRLSTIQFPLPIYITSKGKRVGRAQPRPPFSIVLNRQ